MRFLLSLLLLASFCRAETADWIISARYVVTMDGQFRVIENGAVAIRGERIAAAGTAAEITPIRSVDKIPVGNGSGRIGAVSRLIRDELFGIFEGKKEDRYGWFTPVPVKVKVGA